MEAQFDASFGPMSDATAEISAAIHRIMGDDPFEKAAVSHARQFSLFNGILHNGHRTPVRTESNRDLLREEAPSTRRIPRWCGCDAFCFFARGGSAFRWSSRSIVPCSNSPTPHGQTLRHSFKILKFTPSPSHLLLSDFHLAYVSISSMDSRTLWPARDIYSGAFSSSRLFDDDRKYKNAK
ncbi:hypothetical protein GEV33_002661 [Tenebrio molitor]|uniref:Uncharacterized protein n=1 Tax=Tenebrio molitor TaxID=7067 RepID=A0A8J6LFU9_TENMO|nr:hypothetical protein GEV33_002661 [Tenebrio molitor]